MSRAAATIGWGFFCTSSWTWCIGMFLPVILLGYWGWPGFWAFAIPNVLGCAGFGYLCSKPRSERLVRDHATAMVGFSAVTIAYQIFFVAAVASERFAPNGGSGGFPTAWFAAFACAAVAIVLSLLPDRRWPLAGTIATIGSLLVWFAIGPARLASVPSSGDQPPESLLWAVPIIALGFLLCPWLDRTFHRARQASPSRHAFAVFGLSFFLMILMSAAYAENGAIDLVPAVVAHLFGQATFTVAAHLRELRLAPTPTRRRSRQLVVLIPFLVGALASDLPLGFERTYLLFLGAYGLLFPAYVLLFMAPGAFGRLAWPRSVAGWTSFGLVVLALAPFTSLGFLDLKTWLLPIPVVILMAAAILVGLRGRAGVPSE